MDALTQAHAPPRPHPLARLLLFVPLAAVLLAWPVPATGLAPWEWGTFLVAGLLLWTLLEYLLHRYAFHWIPRSRLLRRIQRHLDHHAQPENPRYSVASLSFSIPVTLVVWAALVLVTGSWQRGSVFTTGAILGYLFYEVVHFSTHFSLVDVQPFRFWRRYHFEHHRHATRCFGFTTPLWDIAFGTGPRPDSRPPGGEPT